MQKFFKIGLMLCCLCFVFGCQRQPNMSDAERETLKKQIGQLLILGFEGKSLQADNPLVTQIQQGLVGGVILFDYHLQKKTFDKNIESPEQVKALIGQLQQIAADHGAPPLLVGVDYEGGRVNRLKQQYGFPETLTAAKLATLSDELAHHYAVQMAETLRRLGFNIDFAPVLDVNTNPDNPVIGKLERSYGHDPQTISFYAAIFADAMHGRGIACAYKHFPGHGSSTADSHHGFVDVTNTWQELELLPYKISFAGEKTCEFVMTAHIVNRQLDPSGLPATLSKPILTDLLRGKLRYRGIIVSDDMQMQAITSNYSLTDAVVKSINAGADMLVFGNQLVPTAQDPKEIIDIVIAHVESGDIDRERIDDAYERVMQFKKKLGKQKS